MSLESEVSRGIDAALKIYAQRDPLACRVTIHGVTIDCLPQPTPDATTLLRGGYIASYQASIGVRAADLPRPVTSGLIVTRRGRQSKVLSVDDGAGISPLVVLHLGSVDE